MRNRHGFTLAAMTLLPGLAIANGNDDLDKVKVPILDQATVTATPGKGITVDAGDAFKMNLKNRLQVGWRFSALDVGGSNQTFRVRRARVRFKGHVFSPDTTYKLNIELAGGAPLLDAWVKQRLWSNEEWSLSGRLGAGKTGYGQESTGTSAGLEFTERSIAARSLSDNRQTGLLLELAGVEDKFHANVGVFNADPAPGATYSAGANSANPDNELNFLFGARYGLNGDMGGESYRQGDLARSEDWNVGVHANLWIGNERVAGTDIDVISINAGAVVKGQGVHGLFEFFSHSAEADTPGSKSGDTTGINAQASYTLEEGWGFGVRFSSVMVDKGPIFLVPTSTGATGGGTALVGSGDVNEISVGVSRYFNGHHRKVQADVTFQSVDPDTGTDLDNVIFRLLATLEI